MGPQPPVPDYTNVNNAKDLFDEIGKFIKENVHGEALEHSKSDLQGILTNVKYPNDRKSTDSTPKDPCQLNHSLHTNVTDGYENEYPCLGRKTVRFSDTEGAQCHTKKIKDSTTDTVGACAPYRRSSLCDHHLSHMKAEKINTKDNLLLEVCLAAQYEGQSIRVDHDKYKIHNPDSQLCTELARSFADIGDIIRGKDMYVVNKGEKRRLEDNLQKIFKEIYEELNGDAQKRYKKDEDDGGNYFQLREDWWDANRAKVWEAITCHAGQSAQYFRQTCGDGRSEYQAKNKCTCNNGDVPTYFDYVPQYLRWFEEWAEYFCRLRKKKLKNAIKNCRENDKKGKPRYCDRYGLDCEKTIRRKRFFYRGEDCNKCSVACDEYVKWIGKQKQEFLKQKQKYEKEMQKYTNGESGSRRQKRDARSSGSNSNYDGYESKFYDILKTKGGVDEFLKLLKEQSECTKFSTEEGKIDFKTVDVGKNGDSVASDSNNSNKTFAPTEYCDPCPLCRVTWENGKWNDKKDSECVEVEQKKTYPKSNTTDIPVLTPEKGKFGIYQKYRNFCQNLDKKDEQIENWQCHYEDTNRNNCILGEWKNFKNEQNPISYYSFFYRSFTEMLKDSVEWREKLNNCINNKTGKCKNQKCKEYCECFKSWIGEKEKEFEGIKEHFGKQKDLLEEIKGEDPNVILIPTLSDYFLQDMKDAKGDPKAIKRIEELLEKKKVEPENHLNNKTIIEYMFKDDLKEIDEKCKDCKPPESPASGLGRSETLTPEVPPPHTEEEEVESDSEEEEETKPAEKAKEDKVETEEKKEEAETATDPKILCGITKTLNCGDLKIHLSTSTNKPKKNLIGLGAHNRIASTKYKVYISPRVQQLYLQPLQELAKTNGDTKGKSELIEALKECAYNEGRELYQYYKNNKDTIGKNGSKLSDQEIKTYTLEAMKRSYADYGNIVKGNMLWEYPDKSKTEPKIIDFAKNHKSTTTSSVSTSDDDDAKRPKLWESIRIHVWKAMLCGYKNAIGGDMNRLPNGDDLCKLPTTDGEYPFLRWFEEWGQNFCIRRDHELNQLKDKCKNGICNDSDESKKEACQTLCKKYEQFINNWRNQFEKQSIEYYKLSNKMNEIKEEPLDFLKETCADKCSCFKKNDEIFSYNVFEHPPEDVQLQCSCTKMPKPKGTPLIKLTKAKQIPPKPQPPTDEEISNCPIDEKICNYYNAIPVCRTKNKQDDLNSWHILNLRDSQTKNKGVFVPPRRRHLCIKNIQLANYGHKVTNKLEHFKHDLLKGASAEAKSLSEKYSNDNKALLTAMKYSFADIGNIVKGDDMLEDIRARNITDIFNKKIIKQKSETEQFSRVQWWEKNKQKVWNVMMCQYKGKDKTDDKCSSHDSIDKIPQFLRWFAEWRENFCSTQNKLYNNMKNICDEANCDRTKGLLDKRECTEACKKYKNFILSKIIEFNGQKSKYDNEFKDTTNDKDVLEFLKNKCFNNNCNCLSENFKDVTSWENPYESITDQALKNKCECKIMPPETKTDDTSAKEQQDAKDVLPPQQSDETMNNILSTTIPLGIALALSSIAFLFLK
ncbi:hypothetical protein PFTANZ_05905, partial [Plasmodium falciparum Tanzania (2000708)]